MFLYQETCGAALQHGTPPPVAWAESWLTLDLNRGTPQSPVTKKGVTDRADTVAGDWQQTVAQAAQRDGGACPECGLIGLAAVQDDLSPEHLFPAMQAQYMAFGRCWICTPAAQQECLHGMRCPIGALQRRGKGSWQRQPGPQRARGMA